ncbi:MAG: histidinol-phosphate transaminase [Alphaproteobacteria bacterium]|nr:histidinol-phosphate transaminase [Alphaproteobacteria bacterium]
MPAPDPRAGILDIAPYVPGRDGGVDDVGDTILLSSNESPLGPSRLAVAAARAACRDLHRYPDPGSTPLRAALARRYGLDAGRIVCGAGSDELIGLVARGFAGPGDEIVHSRHGFVMYPIAAHAAGATPIAVPEPDLRFDVDGVLARVNQRTRVVFVANPNNPTGSHLSGQELDRLRRHLPAGVLLVVDAAYAEYVSAPDYASGLELAAAHDNVVTLRTFSKIHGLAALRVGWAYGPRAVIDVLHRIRGPFNLSSAGIAAATATLADPDHERKARAHNDRWLPWLRRHLDGLGLATYPSIGNFVLVRFPPPPAAVAAAAYLAERRILVRAVASYGLPDCLRITVGRGPELKALVAALAEFLSRR